MDGDPVGTGLDVNILVYDYLVSDKSRELIGQEIGREEPRERRDVAERMVVLERVHVSEIGCNVSLSVKLDASFELQVEENCHRFGKRLVKFGFGE